MKSAKQNILNYLRGFSPLTASCLTMNDIAGALDLSVATVRRNLRALEREGALKLGSNGPGRAYTITLLDDSEVQRG